MKKYEKGRDKEMERLKMCNAEAMKLIKDLEEEKKLLIYNEDNRATVSYKEGEAKPAPTYHYKETRERIAALDERIRKIKFELAKSNCAVLSSSASIHCCSFGASSSTDRPSRVCNTIFRSGTDQVWSCAVTLLGMNPSSTRITVASSFPMAGDFFIGSCSD